MTINDNNDYDDADEYDGEYQSLLRFPHSRRHEYIRQLFLNSVNKIQVAQIASKLLNVDS